MARERRELHVLVVDDNSMLRLLLVEVLAQAGCRVSTACDGVEAVNILEEEPVDFLITDYDMPRMNGLELIRWSKANLPHMTVVMMSGRNCQALAAEGRECGALRILRKPISVEHLLSLVGEFRKTTAPP